MSPESHHAVRLHRLGLAAWATAAFALCPALLSAQNNVPNDVQEQDPGTVTETRTVLGQPPQPASATPAASASPVADPPTNEAITTDPPSAHSREAEKQYLKGAKALDAQDIRGAAAAFGRAVDLDPHNQRYILASEIARQHLVQLLVEEGEKARMMGHSDIERARLTEALALDPKNTIVTQHIGELAGEVRDPQSETLTQPTEAIAPPIQLEPVDARKSFHLHTDAVSMIRQIVSSYGLIPVFDDSVVAQSRRIDADDVDFAQAAEMVKLVTGTFFVPLDPKRVLIAADNKMNRDKFQRLAEETVYLPGLTPAEVTDVGNIARNIFNARSAAVLQARGFLTVRAPVDQMNALNAVLTELLDGHSEIELEIRAFEVDTTKTVNIGVVPPSQTTLFNVDSEVNSLLANNQSLVDQIISSGLANAGDTLAIAAILIASGQVTGSILNSPFAIIGGGLTATGIIPGSASANLSLNSSDVRSLDDITLRVLDQQDGTFRVGSRYPITTSTVTSTTASIPGITTAGLSSTLAGLGITPSALADTTQTTIPQIQYEDLGLTLKATPRVQANKEVNLKLDLKIEALGGSALDNIPILNNRQFTQIITIKDGTSVMLVSNLTRQEMKAVTGIPGLSDLPGFGSATDKSTELDVSRLVITVTTHIVRQSHGNTASRMIVFPVHE